MASNSVILKGTTYNGVSSLEVPKSGGGTALFTDVSDTTAAAADVAAGKWFYNALGAYTAGTASGGGGLAYETGTWTPTENVADTTISLSGTHSTAPFFYIIIDATNAYSDTTNANHMVLFVNFNQALNALDYVSSTNIRRGTAVFTYRGTATASLSNATTSFTADTQMDAYATSTSIRAYGNSSSRYWLANRTYKWIAVWAPTS